MWNHRVIEELAVSAVQRMLKLSQMAGYSNIWNDCADACVYLRSIFPDFSIESEPYVYFDLNTREIGFIFVKFATDTAVFVFESL